MRLLFVMPYPAYLRGYGPVVNALAERGHEVVLAYDQPEKHRDAPPLPAGAPPSVRLAERVPWPGGRWWPLMRLLRLSTDYARFLDPRFADAQPLRQRMDRYLPERMAFLRRVSAPIPLPAARLMLGLARAVERVVPCDAVTREFVRSLAPDAVLVTPVVTRGEIGAKQAEAVKSGRSLGVPTAVAVGSWDHLTSKGLLRGDPDRVIVWNEVQRREAVDLHGVPEERVVLTGSYGFDPWFERRPTVDREAFAARVGLPGDRPVVLYVGSSKNIAEPAAELAFVRRWVEALRASTDLRVRELAVLVRPHPGNMSRWREVDGASEGFAVWPRERPSPTRTEAEEADFFHSLHHSSAVVGVNTSAMIEAAIVGRPVLTVRAPEFSSSQSGTVHFRYLVPEGGGPVQTADDLSEHLDQLSRALAEESRVGEQLREFVERFVRPRGLDKPATPILVEEIEALAELRRHSPRLCERVRQALVPAR